MSSITNIIRNKGYHFAVVRWTEKDVAHLSVATGWNAPSGTTTAGSKYRALRTWVDGIQFSSKLEAKHYNELKVLQQSGQIAYFLRQVPFHIRPDCVHRVDWGVCIARGTELLFAESKGFDLAMGKLKRKLVLDKYGITILVWDKSVDLSSSYVNLSSSYHFKFEESDRR